MICNNKSKKGTTLLELTIVIAVLSIISVMVISFTVFFNARVKTTLNSNKLIQDVASIQSLTESWIDNLTENGAEFSCENGVLSSTLDQNVYTISLADNLLLAPLPNGTTLSCSISQVSRLSFSVYNNLENSDTIYICKAFYPLDNTIKNFSFTINPYVGDLVI